MHDRIVFNPLVPPDVQHVAKAFVGDHPCTRAFRLEYRVRGSGRPVKGVVNLFRADCVQCTQGLDTRDDAFGWIIRGRYNLVDSQCSGVGIYINEICKRPADIHTKGYPLIAGLKLAGTVNAVGSDVTGINVGDRVAAVLSAISDGTLKVPVEGEYAFEDVHDMFAARASRQVSGKVVLKISAD